NLLTVTATASDNSGIDRVELYVDWQLEATAQAAPFAFNSINVSSLSTGSHIVTAMAYSNAGVRNCYAVTLNKQWAGCPVNLTLSASFTLDPVVVCRQQHNPLLGRLSRLRALVKCPQH